MSPVSAHLDAATTPARSVLAELGIASGVVRLEWIVATGPSREDSASLIATVACAQGDGDGYTLSMELVSPTSRRLLATGVPCEVSRFAPDLIHLGAVPDRPQEVGELYPDIGRMRDELGVTAAISLHQGMGEAIAWWNSRAL